MNRRRDRYRAQAGGHGEAWLSRRGSVRGVGEWERSAWGVATIFGTEVRVLGLVFADRERMTAYITVTDAAGRVLFRRAATDGEVREAVRAAEHAELEGEEAMLQIAAERVRVESTEADQP